MSDFQWPEEFNDVPPLTQAEIDKLFGAHERLGQQFLKNNSQKENDG